MELGWVEIEAHRVLVVTVAVLRSEFELTRGGDGSEGCEIELARRLRDGKVFRLSPWQPRGSWSSNTVALREA